MKKRLLITGSIVCLIISIIALIFVFFADKKFDGKYYDDGKVVIANNVVIYDENSPFKILETTDDYIIVDRVEGFDDNSIISAGVTGTTPFGILRWVGDATPVPNGYKVETEPAALTDAILKCNISGKSVMQDDDSMVVTQCDSKNQHAIDWVQKAFADNKSPASQWTNWKGMVNFAVEISSDFNLQIYDGEMEMRMVFNFKMPITFELKKTITSSETIWQGPSKPVGPFEIGPVPVVFLFDYGVDIESQIKLKAVDLDIGCVFDKSWGVEVSTRNGVRTIEEDRSTGLETNINKTKNKFSLTATLSAPVIWAELKLYGLAGLRGQISLTLESELSVKILGPGDDGYGQGFTIPFLDDRMMGEAKMKLYTPMSLSFAELFHNRNIFAKNIGKLKDHHPDGTELLKSDGFVFFEIDEKYGEVPRFDVPEYMQGKFGQEYDDFFTGEKNADRCYMLFNPDGTVRWAYERNYFPEEENYVLYEIDDMESSPGDDNQTWIDLVAIKCGSSAKIWTEEDEKNRPFNKVFLGTKEYPEKFRVWYHHDKDYMYVPLTPYGDNNYIRCVD